MVVVVTHRLGEDLGDAVDHGVDPGGVAGGDAGDDVAVAELVGAGEADVALVAGPFAFGAVGLGVGLDDLGSGDLEDGRGCVPADGLRDGAVHAADLLGEQGAGQHGDLAGHPRLAVAGLDDRPGERQSVDEVEPVGDQCPRRGGMGLADHRQLGDRVLAHGGVPSPPGVTIGSRSSRGCPWMMAHWIASRSSATSARRRVRSAWVAQSSSSLADASSSAGGGWWARRVVGMPQSIEHMFDRQRLWAPVWGATCRASHKRNVPWWSPSADDQCARSCRTAAWRTLSGGPARRRTVRHMPRLRVATWLLPAIATPLVWPRLLTPTPLASATREDAWPLRSHSDQITNGQERVVVKQQVGTAGKRFADLASTLSPARGPRGPDDPSWHGAVTVRVIGERECAGVRQLADCQR